MTTFSDFNRIEDCNKTDAECIDAYSSLTIDGTKITSSTSWGNSTIDIKDAVVDGQALTSMYLSPGDNPNCLVYEPEYGDNECINGNDLSKIISMRELKDVDRTTAIGNRNVYLYDTETQKFIPYDLGSVIDSINSTIQNLSESITDINGRLSEYGSTISSLASRITAIETTLTKPYGVPSSASVVWGNVNVYSDTNATVNASGVATSLDKTHGLYSHNVSNDAYGDELFG